jgi:NADPH:quinone reductase-like Zn-dependent oxidoreductase
LLGEGKLRARIDSTFPLERGVEAIERLRDGKQMGKIVIEVGGEQ